MSCLVSPTAPPRPRSALPKLPTAAACPPLAADIDRDRPALRTSRLELRAPSSRDVEAIATLANDRRVAENTTHIPYPCTPADVREWLAICNRADGEATFVITLGGETVIGACGVGRVASGHHDLGYWLGPAHWGRGFAREAVCAIIDFAFGEMDIAVLSASARVATPQSRRLLEMCGFRWVDVGLARIRALGCSVPIDRLRLERDASLPRVLRAVA